MKFRKRPVVIEAIRFDGIITDELGNFIGRSDVGDEYNYLSIHTLEGTMRAEKGDWIIKGIRGEFYPCKPDIFEATYEPVPPEKY